LPPSDISRLINSERSADVLVVVEAYLTITRTMLERRARAAAD
jgi:hypothetical protein